MMVFCRLLVQETQQIFGEGVFQIRFDTTASVLTFEHRHS
jgi:hypothetical protein